MAIFRAVIEKIKNLNSGLEKYKKETIIPSLPSVASVNRAKKLIEENELEQAKEILLQALEFPDKNPLVYKYLGAVYDRLRDYANAAEAYQTAAELNPNDKNIWQKLGFALFSLGKLEESVKSFENADRIVPFNTDNFTGWGMTLMKMCRFEEALEKFNKAVLINKYNFTAILLAAMMHMKLNEYDKADSKLSFLVNTCPDATNSFEYANLKYIRGDLSNAVFYAQKTLEYNPCMLSAYILLGRIYAKNCDREKALFFFRTAFGKDLVNGSLYLYWAEALIKFGNYSAALEKLLAGLALEPENEELKSQLEICNALLGHFEDMHSKPAGLAAGIRAYEDDEFEKAIRLLRDTLDDEADDSISRYYLAKAHQATGNDTKTRENYEAALEKNPEYVPARLEYVKYLISKGDYSAARYKLRKAVKIDEPVPELLNLLFFVNYVLVKQNPCKYNIMETLAIAARIPPEQFEYESEKAQLQEMNNE